MEIIKTLFSALNIMIAINATMSLVWYWPKKENILNDTDDRSENGNQWTWKETLLIILTLCSMAAIIIPMLLFGEKYGLAIFWVLFVLSHYLNMGTNLLPSAKILGNIINGSLTGNLNKKDGLALLTLAMIFGYCNIFEIPSRILKTTNLLSNDILADWILMLIYIVSIFGCVFFCCSLTLTPLKFIMKVMNCIKNFTSKYKIRKIGSAINKFVEDAVVTKTISSSVIQYSFKTRFFFKIILWITVIPVMLFDIIRIIISIITKLFVSIFWYAFIIIKQVLNLLKKIVLWLTNLESRNVVAISFRVAMILALGLTVIINRYEPFLRNYEESSAILEFVSSSVIIPIIFEWIISYEKNSKENPTKQN